MHIRHFDDLTHCLRCWAASPVQTRVRFVTSGSGQVIKAPGSYCVYKTNESNHNTQCLLMSFSLSYTAVAAPRYVELPHYAFQWLMMHCDTNGAPYASI